MSATILWAIGAIGAGLSSFIWGPSAESRLTELRPLLSKGAAVYLPGSDAFTSASSRWSSAIRPDYEAIIRVKTEEDVQHIIQYANKRDQDFLAISGGHGQPLSLNNLKRGLGIDMRGMKKIEIVDDGKAVLIGGGVQTGELLPALWDAGKQTVTTGCECAGFIAPIMGGGHGWLQGRYGLVADNLLSARMVLANGTAITVSDTERSDLFWAIRGAGHNFGIYTEIKVKIYDREPAQDEWAADGFIFTEDKLESVFTIVNGWLESPKRPVELTHYGVYAFIPDIDVNKPVLILWLYWQGSKIPAAFTDPLNALKPITVDSSVTDLAGVNSHLGARYDGVACEKGSSRLQYPISADTYDLPALRKTMDILTNVPEEFKGSIVMLEGYATNRVGEFSTDSISYPDRGGQLLLAPLLTYPANASLDEKGFEIGDEMRKALVEGTGKPLVAYVNYAHGDESMEEIYGYEPWRLEKLRKLKAEYDPLGKFNFYAPIK